MTVHTKIRPKDVPGTLLNVVRTDTTISVASHRDHRGLDCCGNGSGSAGCYGHEELAVGQQC